LFPTIEVRPSAQINGANGAFAVATNKIYLAEELLLGSGPGSEAVVAVLLEEVGHFIDAQLNAEDTPGDEGAIFSALVRGQELGAAQLAALQAEDDRATVVLDGQSVEIEQAGLSITPMTTPDGYRVDGDVPGNLLNLGWVVVGNGNINGDNFQDFVALAPGANGNTGELHVVFGSSDLSTSPTHVISLNSLGPPTQISLALGDINQDGNADLIIGNPGTGTGPGEVKVVFGGAPASLPSDLNTLNGTNGFTILNQDGGSSPDLLGWSVSSGDINGDQIQDVIVGDLNVGTVSVVFGQTSFSGPTVDLSAPGSVQVRTFTGPTNSQVGFSVAAANLNGDTNGPNDIDDILVGAPSAGSSSEGATYAIFGNTTIANIATAPGDFIFQGQTTTIPPGTLGTKVDSVGDVNGDNVDDFIVTEPGGSANQRTYVVFGGPSLSGTLATTAINGSNGFFIDGLNATDVQFEAISGAGDINADGIDDLLIAEPFDNAGKVYIIYGKNTGFSSSIDISTLTPNDGFEVIIPGLAPNGFTGLSISDAGDLNGDGGNDFLIGAPGTNSADGTVYAVLGEIPQNPIPNTTVNINSSSTNYRLIGENHTFRISFDNEASSPGNVGYGPFVNLYLDTSGVDGEALGQVYDGLELQNIRYVLDSDTSQTVGSSGNAILDGLNSVDLSLLNVTPTYRPIYLNASNDLVVDHPYTTAPIPAPAGYQVGDTLVVFDVPQGSFSPAQTPARFDVDVRISQFADYNQPLNISTSGGFRYGGNAAPDPTNPMDPVMDPTVTNDTLTPLLYRIRKTGPGETVTGPNYEQQYNISVDVAPGQTIDNLLIIDTLPNNVQFVAASGTGTPGGTATTTTPGGTVELSAGTVTGAAGTDASLSIDFFVPLNDTSNNPVIDPNTGDAVTSTDIASLSNALAWNPLDPQDQLFTGSFVEPNAVFTHSDRSIAVQKKINSSQPAEDNNTSGFSPGDIIEHIVTFQISDYFAFGSLILEDVFTDGQEFITASNITATDFSPTFEVYEHGNLSSGDFIPSWITYTDPSNGNDGTLTLDISAALDHANVGLNTSDKLLGGYIDNNGNYLTTSTNPATTGTIKFYTQIQEDFTESGIDTSVDNGDIFFNTATIKGDILEVNSTPSLNLTTTSTTEDEEDGGNARLTLPRGKFDDYLVTVYEIRDGSGNLKPGNTVTPGDLVTYRIQDKLPFADNENLRYTSNLPDSIFDISGVNLSINPLGTYPVPINQVAYGPADQLHTFNPLSIGFNGPATTTLDPTVSVDLANDQLIFDYGIFDDPGTSNEPVIIDLLYTLEVQPISVANGLLLNNLVEKSQGSTNNGAVSIYNQYAFIELEQPVLNIQKGAIASSENKAVFSEFFPTVGVPGDPGTIEWDGSGFTNTISSDVLDSTNYFNSDVTADLNNAGTVDSVTFAIIVENTGPGTAFNALIEDILPTGHTASDVTNLEVRYGTGAPISFGGDLTNGITLDEPIEADDPTSGENIAIITYDLEIQDGLADGETLTNTAILQEYSDASTGGMTFLPGTLSLQDQAQVRTQAYLQEQFETQFPGVNLGGQGLSGAFFDASTHLGSSALDYRIVIKQAPALGSSPATNPFLSLASTIYDSATSPNLGLQNPFGNINPVLLDFTFNSSLGFSVAGDYIVEVRASDSDPGNDPTSYDVKDEFVFRIDFSGTVTNNYIAYANVFFDANNNRIQDPGEAVAITDENGNFTIQADLSAFDIDNSGILDPSEGQFVAINGINTATGQPLSVPLSATSDASVITPLTTLAAGLVAQGHTINQANTLLTTAFGIDNSVNLGQFDPIAATQNNSANGVETYLAHTQVQITLGLLHSLFQGATNGGPEIIDNVITAIVTQIEADSTLDPTNTTQLESILTQTAADLGIDIASDISGAAQIIAAANQAVADAAASLPATDLEAAFAQIEKVALGETSQDLQTVGDGTKPIGDAIAENTGAPLQTQINAAQVLSADPTDISLSSDTVGSGQAIGTEVGTFSTEDPDVGETHTYHFVPTLGTSDNDLFEIDGNRLLTKQSFDHTVQNTYNINVFSSDGNGGIYTEELTINIGPSIPDANIIDGTPSRETLTGTSGRDIITGFQGRDRLIGGAGDDDFVYTNMADAWDRITDFEVDSDRIVLTQLLDSLGYSGINPIDEGYIKFQSRGNGTMVQIDPDGDGSARARSLVYVENVALTDNNANSFVF
jgi:uncharacterized repeat protein (TIGR01451 family)